MPIDIMIAIVIIPCCKNNLQNSSHRRTKNALRIYAGLGIATHKGFLFVIGFLFSHLEDLTKVQIGTDYGDRFLLNVTEKLKHNKDK